MIVHKKLVWVIFALICQAPPLTAEDTNDVITWKDDVKGWYIAVDRTINNSCFMFSSYEGGTFLRFQFDRQNDVMEFIVGNDKWQSLEEGKFYDLQVQFGNETAWSGKAVSWHFAGTPSLSFPIPFSDNKAPTFIEELRRNSGVNISYQGRFVEGLKLTGSFAAVTELVNCQSAMMELYGNNSTNDPFSSSKNQGDPFQ